MLNKVICSKCERVLPCRAGQRPMNHSVDGNTCTGSTLPGALTSLPATNPTSVDFEADVARFGTEPPSTKARAEPVSVKRRVAWVAAAVSSTVAIVLLVLALNDTEGPADAAPTPSAAEVTIPKPAPTSSKKSDKTTEKASGESSDLSIGDQMHLLSSIFDYGMCREFKNNDDAAVSKMRSKLQGKVDRSVTKKYLQDRC